MSVDNPGDGRRRTESDLREELQGGTLPDRTPDVDLPSVLRRSSRRRAPVQIALGTGVAVAVIALGAGGLTGLRELGFRGIGFASSASDSAAVNESGADEAAPGEAAPGGFVDPSAGGMLSLAPADKINFCGGALAELSPSDTGLVLTASFADALAGTESVTGTVTLTNTGTSRVTGTTTTTPAITLSQGGLVLWHSNGPTITSMVDVDLAPGGELQYPASFEPVRCGVEDDGAPSFRPDLPAVPAGRYDVSAAIDLTVVDGTPVLVTGPLARVSLG